jgi:N-acetylmuramoyl-L-alanine amidase
MMDRFYILDSGHGATTPGKRSPDSTLMEWANNRRVAEAIRKEMYNRSMRRIDIIGSSPIDVPLKARVQHINFEAQRAIKRGLEPICLSIHSNASQNSGWGAPAGVTVIGHPGNKKALTLASRLSQGIAQATGMLDRGAKGYRWLYLIRKTVPDTLILELGFHDNKGDVAIMLRPEYPKQVAGAVCDVLQGV